ncbi:MAG: SMC-Scp complex subunit ScpB [Candidatus Odinarchaeum yellowstonii]|uniref:SMC-Scp complex subunit ScpB n=1 Tax=Odinarchaeota yellowstonii (strain LCB_4) TaxID=1841599 RepID=A0AAF0D1G8_ODILC|nr:MAG: SMC-Scp complex subunit ScpB [Candidatus Odinarchaeum yellowstonii]
MPDAKLKPKVEAALFIAGRPLSVIEICKAVNYDNEQEIKTIVEELRTDYQSRDSALEIAVTSNNKYVLQLKPLFPEIIAKLAPPGLLTLGALKTLSLIALKQPIKQHEVIKIRGSHAYKYIHQLEEKGFIETIPEGRTKILKTSQLFADYFGLDYDLKKLKMQLRWKMRKEGLPAELLKIPGIDDEGTA